MKYLALFLLTVSALGQNLFPGPGSPLQLDSARLYPAIISGGGGTIIITNASFTFLTNQYFISTNAFVTFLTNQNFYVTNVNVYDSVVIETNLTVKQNINVNGKATFNQIIITNGFFSQTNLWSGPTNSVDMSINDQYFTTLTPCQISGIFNTSNSLSSQVTLTILNNSSTNITVTYGSAGFVDRDHVTSQIITNATVGIFWIKHTPALGGHTNVVYNNF